MIDIPVAHVASGGLITKSSTVEKVQEIRLANSPKSGGNAVMPETPLSRALVVDDSSLNRKMLSMTLQSYFETIEEVRGTV